MDIRAIQPLPPTPLLNAIPAPPSSGDPTTALRVRPQPTDAERAKFKKAATEFESFFLYYMMKTMRQAVPKGGLMDSKVGDTYLIRVFRLGLHFRRLRRNLGHILQPGKQSCEFM
jgi:hypothetical protein